MIAGISLFFSIAQKVFAPHEKIVRCDGCGRDRHDRDARHCKACGASCRPPLRAGARGGQRDRPAQGG